jgi:hypothetical protein
MSITKPKFTMPASQGMQGAPDRRSVFRRQAIPKEFLICGDRGRDCARGVGWWHTLVHLRAYCVQLHKLPDNAKTECRLADAADQAEYGSARHVIDRAHFLFRTRYLPIPPGLRFDDVVQWSLWINIEKSNQNAFMDESAKLVHRNYPRAEEQCGTQHLGGIPGRSGLIAPVGE